MRRFLKAKLTHPIMTKNGEAKPEIIIKNLIEGNILPKSKLIITSRPRQLTRLSDDYSSYFIVKHSRFEQRRTRTDMQ